jgi:AraC-like DNA-binding protein
MKLQIKYDIHLACKVILQEHLDRLGVTYEITGIGDVEIKGPLAPGQYTDLQISLNKYGIEILDNPAIAIVNKIKDVITEMVYLEEPLPTSKISAYISDKMKMSNGHISRLFSEVTFSSIQSYIILQRIERAKQLIIENKLNLTEVAWKLNYSSVAHLSNQFKKTTGLTPTIFQRIIERRRMLVLTPDNV